MTAAQPEISDGAPRPVLVVIPTYNEAGSIGPLIGRLRTAVPDADVLVTDDNSPDGTGIVADHLAAADARVHVRHRPTKEGLGAAYLDGFRWGLARGYRTLVEMDGDGSHQPEELPRLLNALVDADLVIGSRWTPGGSIVHWPRHRELLSRGGSWYSRTLLGLPVRDATGGFRALRAGVVSSGITDGIASQGYCFQVDLLHRAARAGHRIAEVPITFIERCHGNSKMSRAIVTEALWRVTAWGVASRFRRMARARHT